MTFKLCYTLHISIILQYSHLWSRNQHRKCRRHPQIPSWWCWSVWSPVHPELSLLPWFVGEWMWISGSEVRRSFPRHSQGKRTSDRTGEFWEPCWTDFTLSDEICVLLLKLCEGGLWVQIKCKTARSHQRTRFVSAVLLNRWLVTQKKGFTVNYWVQTT